jgi:hypothetical protein
MFATALNAATSKVFAQQLSANTGPGNHRGPMSDQIDARHGHAHMRKFPRLSHPYKATFG